MPKAFGRSVLPPCSISGISARVRGGLTRSDPHPEERDHSIECGAGSAMSHFEVSAIDGHQGAASFQNRVCFLRHRLQTCIRKSWCQPTDGIELANQHSWCCCRRLTDLIECEFRKAFEPHRRHPHSESTAGVVPIAFKRRAFSESEERLSEPVHRGNACKSIVDCRRERPDCDLHHLRDAKLAILGKGAVPADLNSLIYRHLNRAALLRRDNCRQRLAAKHEMARTESEHDHSVRSMCCRDQRAMVDGFRMMRRIVAAPPMDTYRDAEHSPGPSIQSDDDILTWIRNNSQTAYHPIGTCRMGPGPNAVVDDKLKVHGLDGLRVADASIFPTMPSGNTNAPSIMVGEKAADILSSAA